MLHIQHNIFSAVCAVSANTSEQPPAVEMAEEPSVPVVVDNIGNMADAEVGEVAADNQSIDAHPPPLSADTSEQPPAGEEAHNVVHHRFVLRDRKNAMQKNSVTCSELGGNGAEDSGSEYQPSDVEDMPRKCCLCHEEVFIACPDYLLLLCYDHRQTECSEHAQTVGTLPIPDVNTYSEPEESVGSLPTHRY